MAEEQGWGRLWGQRLSLLRVCSLCEMSDNLVKTFMESEIIQGSCLRMKKKTIQQFHGEGRNLEKNHEDFLGTGSVCLAAVESPRRAGGRLLGSSGPGHRWGTAQGTGLAGRILQAGAVYT